MVYFIQPVGGGPIKIGTTENLPARLAHLKNQYRVDFVVLSTRDGGRDVEREIHRQFSHLRLCQAEQFRPGDDLMAFIGRENPPGFDPNTVAAMPVPERCRIVVDVRGDIYESLKLIAKERRLTMNSLLGELFREQIERHPPHLPTKPTNR